MKKTLLAVTSLLLISCGKSDIKSQLVGKWDFRNVYNPNNENENYDQEIGIKEIDDLGNENFQGSYYVLNDDNTYYSLHTEGEGGYIEGKWQYSEKDSLLIFHSKNKTQEPAYKVNYLKDNQLSLSDPNPKKVNKEDSYLKQLADNMNHRFKFVKDDFTLDSDYDFTKKSSNLWRTKAQASENKDQIKKRTKDALENAILYLKNGIEEEKKVLSLNPVFLPVDFYGNGVQMKDFDKSYNWNSIFFNDDEAYQGYALINNAMAEDFEVPNNKKPMELNLYILEELNKRIK
ncbi:hypothetical protein [Flavobacterium sp. HJSW_4]|uniref:hypothetical protein n=1 Tax=Flavobacterium sp. HJSW_4 TaxID=3344660 RepID=UPI0035F401F3